MGILSFNWCLGGCASVERERRKGTGTAVCCFPNADKTCGHMCSVLVWTFVWFLWWFFFVCETNVFWLLCFVWFLLFCWFALFWVKRKGLPEIAVWIWGSKTDRGSLIPMIGSKRQLQTLHPLHFIPTAPADQFPHYRLIVSPSPFSHWMIIFIHLITPFKFCPNFKCQACKWTCCFNEWNLKWRREVTVLGRSIYGRTLDDIPWMQCVVLHSGTAIVNNIYIYKLTETWWVLLCLFVYFLITITTAILCFILNGTLCLSHLHTR